MAKLLIIPATIALADAPSAASIASSSSSSSSAIASSSRATTASATTHSDAAAPGQGQRHRQEEDEEEEEESCAAAECRICQEEEAEELGKLERPCACSGSIQYAHRKCVQRWCDEKGDIVCEICQQPFKSGYTAAPSSSSRNDIAIDLGEDYGVELQLAMAAAQRRFLDAQYEEANSRSAACCRSVALTLMALLLLRHAIAMATVTIHTDEDASMLFTLFILRALGFLLPCYIMARAMNMLQRRNQRQDVAMAAADVAFLLQARQSQRILSMAPGQPQATMALHSSARG